VNVMCTYQFSTRLLLPFNELIYRTVIAFSKATGDYAVLSRTDLQVIALTFMLEVEENGYARVRDEYGKVSTLIYPSGIPWRALQGDCSRRCFPRAEEVTAGSRGNTSGLWLWHPRNIGRNLTRLISVIAFAATKRYQTGTQALQDRLICC
jgi:hypothetical protein